jgi:REP element-mobilizing transposase RayT
LYLALADSARSADFRIVHYSIQDRHLHLIVEAKNERWLSRGIQGLKIRIARRLNSRLGRSGPLFADRYHGRILKTPRETWYALRYVLCNARKHGAKEGWGELGDLYDPLSSAAWFEGWEQGFSLRILAPTGQGPPAVAPARTWLMNQGWKRYGRLKLDAEPASRSSIR